MTTDAMPLYNRVLLKLSGEALQGDAHAGIDANTLTRIVDEIVTLAELDIEMGIVVGAGNFCRGRSLQDLGIDNVTADHMGMLATIINALALRDAFLLRGQASTVMSALAVPSIAQPFERQAALHLLEQGHIVIFAGGTGNPLVTTDSAASLRSIEIDADVLLKATGVDGVYSADPKLHADVNLLSHLTYDQVLQQELAVMDMNAFYQCRQHRMPIRVFNINTPGMLVNTIFDEQQGTLIEGEDL